MRFKIQNLIKKFILLLCISGNYLPPTNSMIEDSSIIKNKKIKSLNKIAQSKIIQYLLYNKLDLNKLNIDCLDKIKRRIIKLNLVSLLKKSDNIIDFRQIHEKNAKSAAFSKGKNIIAVGYDGTAYLDTEITSQILPYLKLFNLETLQCIKEFNGPLNVSSLKISPDTKFTLLGCHDGSLILLNLETNESKKITTELLKMSLNAYSTKCDLMTLAVTSDWSFAVTGGVCSKTIILVNLKTFEIDKSIDINQENGIISGDINNKGEHAIFVSFGSLENYVRLKKYGRQILLWDIKNNSLEELQNNFKTQAEAKTAKFITLEDVLIIFNDGTLILYNIFSKRQQEITTINENFFQSVSISKNNKLAFFINTYGNMFLADLKKPEYIKLKTSLNFCDYISGNISADGSYIVAIPRNQNILSISNLTAKLENQNIEQLIQKIRPL